MRLINNYTVANMAQQIVRARYRTEDVDQATLNSGVRKLILTEDYTLMTKLAGKSRGQALDDLFRHGNRRHGV